MIIGRPLKRGGLPVDCCTNGANLESLLAEIGAVKRRNSGKNRVGWRQEEGGMKAGCQTTPVCIPAPSALAVGGFGAVLAQVVVF